MSPLSAVGISGLQAGDDVKNAEPSRHGFKPIIIPASYHDDYLLALRRLSRLVLPEKNRGIPLSQLDNPPPEPVQSFLESLAGEPDSRGRRHHL